MTLPKTSNSISNIVTRIMPRVIHDRRRDDEVSRLNKAALDAVLNDADIRSLND